MSAAPTMVVVDGCPTRVVDELGFLRDGRRETIGLVKTLAFKILRLQESFRGREPGVGDDVTLRPLTKLLQKIAYNVDMQALHLDRLEGCLFPADVPAAPTPEATP